MNEYPPLAFAHDEDLALPLQPTADTTEPTEISRRLARIYARTLTWSVHPGEGVAAVGPTNDEATLRNNQLQAVAPISEQGATANG